MEFNITEIKRTFEEFYSDLDNILSAACDNYEYRLKQFFTRIDSVSVLKTIIKPFLDLELDENYGLQRGLHARMEYVIPKTDEEEIACALQLLRQVEENPNTFMTLVTLMYYKSSYNESINLFNLKIVSPAFQKLKRKLQYKLEDLIAANTTSVDSSKVMIINVGNINASNSTIGIGNGISQDVENVDAKKSKHRTYSKYYYRKEELAVLVVMKNNNITQNNPMDIQKFTCLVEDELHGNTSAIDLAFETAKKNHWIEEHEFSVYSTPVADELVYLNPIGKNINQFSDSEIAKIRNEFINAVYEITNGSINHLINGIDLKLDIIGLDSSLVIDCIKYFVSEGMITNDFLPGFIKITYKGIKYIEERMKSVMEDKNNQNKKVFIVHGRDEGTRLEVTLFVKSLDFEPIILREKESKGMTIIEKIEEYSDVDFAIVLYTPCDIGGLKEDVEKNLSKSLKELEGSGLLKPRARQNVVFEHGYLTSKLGREKVVALVKNGSIDIPNDYAGVVFIFMEKGDWKIELAKEMKAAGLPVDMNKIIS